MKRNKFLPVLVFILLFISGCLGSNNKNEPGIEMKDNFLNQFKFDESISHDHILFTGENNGTIVKIKRFNNYSLEMSENYISDKLFVIELLYREIHSPYPGALSNRIECEDKFKPIKKRNEPFDYYMIYAGERLTYGACSWDLIHYRSILYFLYCGSRNTFYTIEIFIPLSIEISVFEEIVKSSRCLK